MLLPVHLSIAFEVKKNIESKNKMKSCALFEHDDNR